MSEYKPVTVAAAQQVADQFEKDVVVILAIDREHELSHVTTFGRSPQDKLHGAEFGDLLGRLLARERIGEVQVFEDFRLDAAKNKADRDALLAAAERVLAGLDARIDAATRSDTVVPVFDGIADLHTAVQTAKGV